MAPPFDPLQVAALSLAALVAACGPSIQLDDDEASATSASVGPDGGDATSNADATSNGGGDDDTANGDDDDDGDEAPADGDDGGPDEPPGAMTVIAAGEHFIDAFFLDDGLIVVHAHGAQLVSRTGDVLLTHESPRPITSAAFADGLLLLADQAMFTTLDLDFEPLTSAPLTETCVAAAMVSGARFVCGPDNDWDRIFYTYDALSGTPLATSAPYTYHGIPLRRVPGLDELVSVTHDLSPSDYHLHAVDPTTHAAVYVNESPYHGDFRVDLPYAFIGEPATHLVTPEGNLLLIHGDGCTPEENPFTTGCFVKDGELGTLPVDLYAYRDIRDSADGTIYGIVTTTELLGDPPCSVDPCTLQRIDPVRHLVLATTTFTTPRQWPLLRPDPTSPAAAIITADDLPFHYTYDASPTFEVLYVPL